MTEVTAVEARNAVKAFGQGEASVRALDDVSIKINKGEFFTLLGPSGCGKTTLLRLIAGFEMPTSGTILLEGADITYLPPNKRPVNTVFQSYALFPHLTVAQNIGFGLEMQGRPRAEVKATVDRMLALVKLEPMANRKTSQLSGGQQQRVALARALAPAPKVLLLDEPLSALDLKLRKEMQIELKRLQMETGITFVFVTHDQEEALTMSDRIGVMSAGKLQQIGTPREIYTKPVNRFVASFIGETNFLPARRDGDALRLGEGHLIELPAGVPEGRAVTVTVRPEQVRLVDASEAGAIPATVQSLVYFGTDTHCHMALADGTEVVARLQSSATGEAALAQGQKVAFRFAAGAVQVLED
ncbi:MAG: spermidine/putrescine ABC transporter ATP-binding protein [Rhodobacterales bacterium RIFCSPHIGHO2_02_FULL_62_130]|nr:MAG: spermidine/putrescine ABC transporter ATP-binding protein [Rhodobacterales bacterium RIFCSPHIGHO2_02_FULL_62_130]OHC56385.1 MAG: spermidine/putrescine ABC transporter ATP-binding protein [Rhodobacterales bacterium RIFCSPHIGHO2_12_FULL_62_75]